MKLSVTIYGVDNEIRGEIVWDGTRITTTNSSRAMQRAMTDPIYPMGRRNEEIKPDEHPEKFMRNLWLMYKSPYFRAVKAVSL
jgi:hypothetical protein